MLENLDYTANQIINGVTFNQRNEKGLKCGWWLDATFGSVESHSGCGDSPIFFAWNRKTLRTMNNTLTKLFACGAIQ